MTLAQQTAVRQLLKLRVMEVEQAPEEDSQKMIKTNIQEFIETTREHLFGLVASPLPTPVNNADCTVR